MNLPKNIDVLFQFLNLKMLLCYSVLLNWLHDSNNVKDIQRIDLTKHKKDHALFVRSRHQYRKEKG